MKCEKYICKKCGTEFTRRSKTELCLNCRPKTNSKIELECQHCHTMFMGMPDTLYCRHCTSRWVATGASMIQCHVCSKEFKSFYGETVCPQCRHDARIRKSYTRVCELCGKSFSAQYHNETLCTECKNVAGRVECTCVVCGKKFVPKRREVCKTCSRKCQGLYIQSNGLGIKYNDDELYAKVIAHLKATGTPISIEDLGKELGGITHKVFSSRGWTIDNMLKDAGIQHRWFPKNMSLFEHAIYEILREAIPDSINIQLQKVFDDCVGDTGRALRFDFYIEEFNLLIEADGAQHYISDNSWNNAGLQSRDSIKNNYCAEKGISLLRIRYAHHKTRKQNIIDTIKAILPPYGEIRKVNCFNCWNGSELIPIPISNQASTTEEGSQTIPGGSTPKWAEMGSTLTDNAEGEDIVDSAGNT